MLRSQVSIIKQDEFLGVIVISFRKVDDIIPENIPCLIQSSLHEKRFGVEMPDIKKVWQSDRDGGSLENKLFP